MKTFNLVFSILLLSSLFITSCSDNTEQVSKPVPIPDPTPIDIPTSSFTDQERVCNLAEAAYNMLIADNKTSLHEYFDEDLNELLEIENPTSGELEEMEDLYIEGIGNMFTSDGSFQTAFNNVVALNLDPEDLQDYLLSCTIVQLTEGSGSRWCWDCDSWGCFWGHLDVAAGTALLHGGIIVVGYIEQFLHCDH